MTAGYDRLRSNLAQLAKMAGQGQMDARAGTVSSYDPDGYLVKIRLQPEDIETGWLPIGQLMVGQGWGICAGPAIGDQALCVFLQGDINAGVCVCFLGSDEDPPPRVLSGEVHLRAQGDAASIILKPDGSIASKGTWTHTGDLVASGTINGQTDVIAAGKSGKNHTHGGVQTGSGHSLKPD